MNVILRVRLFLIDLGTWHNTSGSPGVHGSIGADCSGKYVAHLVPSVAGWAVTMADHTDVSLQPEERVRALTKKEARWR
ncbi:hypothetical protein INR49_018206 [Caranx melampygus]|nr:hypothetical protein INR49_018206 [Caranx melampygus]